MKKKTNFLIMDKKNQHSRRQKVKTLPENNQQKKK